MPGDKLIEAPIAEANLGPPAPERSDGRTLSLEAARGPGMGGQVVPGTALRSGGAGVTASALPANARNGSRRRPDHGSRAARALSARVAMASHPAAWTQYSPR
jgi:hypothetical protein